MLATGFSPRKTNLSVYIMPGYADFTGVLGRLGKHRIGKSCLYINKLADIDIVVLSELIRAGLRDISRKCRFSPPDFLIRKRLRGEGRMQSGLRGSAPNWTSRARHAQSSATGDPT
ncbi:DUF1801 domain-containing protein [Yoonia sp.]|uniref:DUF1801 domain-containing protein n=1 Tax=Yoonia sp. TaxID=2212373 RepID=UPI0035C7D80F